MLEAANKIITEYGLPTLIVLSGLAVIAWFARVAIKNPLEVVSGALADVDKARIALRDEIEHKDQLIAALRERIAQAEAEIQELKEHVERLETQRL